MSDMPTNVIEALARITAEMPAIGKTQTGKGLNYKFRSVEQVTGHAAQLFAKYGVVIVPFGEEIEYTEVATAKGGSMTEARTKFSWHIYGPGGLEDVIFATTFGQARDSSDKSANKAHTAAYKYLLMTLLCISDDKEDPDYERPGDEGDLEVDEQIDQELEDRISQLLTEAVEGKERFGDQWAQVLRTEAAARGYDTYNAWCRGDTEAAETFTAGHKLRAMAAEAKQATKDTKTRAKVGSAVRAASEESEEDVAAAARRIAEAFPGTEEEEQLDLD